MENLLLKHLETVLAPIPNALTGKIRKYPNMHDEEYARKRFDDAASMGPLVLPHCKEESRRVVYSITEYDPILDSSNMTIQDWVHIAKDIHVGLKIFLKIPANNMFLSSSNHTSSSMDLWFFMAQTPFPTQHPPFPSCLKIWVKRLLLLVHKFLFSKHAPMEKTISQQR